jgi:acyl carrier protein
VEPRQILGLAQRRARRAHPARAARALRARGFTRRDSPASGADMRLGRGWCARRNMLETALVRPPAPLVPRGSPGGGARDGRAMTANADKILDIVAREAKKDRAELTLDTRLEDLKIESLDLVQILFAIEDEFDVYVPYNDESYKLETLRDVVDGVDRLIAEKKQTETTPAA